MSLTESEIKKIKKYYNKTFEHSDKQYTYNLLDIIKYVVYWKSLMEENKDKLVNIPQVMQVQQDMVFGYDQLKHISQGDLDDNSPKSIMKRHIAMFTKANNINELINELRSKDEKYKLAFDDLGTIRIAADQKLVDLEHPLTNISEVAFFPPMTGG